MKNSEEGYSFTKILMKQGFFYETKFLGDE